MSRHPSYSVPVGPDLPEPRRTYRGEKVERLELLRRIIVTSGAEPLSPLAQSCEHWAEELAREGVESDVFITPGNAPSVLLEAVARFDPDLLAIGGRRQSTAEALLSGQSWWQVVEQLQIPVLLYR